MLVEPSSMLCLRCSIPLVSSLTKTTLSFSTSLWPICSYLFPSLSLVPLGIVKGHNLLSEISTELGPTGHVPFEPITTFALNC